MRTLFFLLLIFISSVAFVSCKKGDTGPAGADGNANVTQYTFGQQNLAAGFVALQVTTTEDTLNNSHWFVYLFAESLNRWYSIPGAGVGGYTQYRLSIGYVAGKVNLYIDKSGPGEVYSKARVVRVYINQSSPGGRTRAGDNTGLPDIDFTDYETVRRFYHLP